MTDSARTEADQTREDEEEGRATASGLPDPEEVSEEERREIEEERQRRLAPENRPDKAEVDNTDRDFDLERGDFVDNIENRDDDGDDDGDDEDAES